MRGSRHRTCSIDELISAIRQKRDIAEIRQIISGVDDINQASTSSYDEGRTPLHIAAQNGHPEIVKLLLDRGAEVNQAGRYGTTPLHIAAHRGHREAVQLLLDRGAEVNQSDNDGTTPLWVAAETGQLELAQLCLDRGAEVNQADDDGETPLYIAVIDGHRETVQLLLDRGADVNKARTRDGETPLWVAVRYGHAAIVAQLLAVGADVTQAGRYGTTPLCFAAFRGHAAAALLLKLAGARRGDIDFEKNDAVFKQAIKTSDLLQIITQRFPESSADLHTALDKSLDNITDIDTLLKFSINLENKFNQIIHPISTANISHMVNQFLPGKLPDKLIGEISNLEILALDEQDLRGAINTGAIVAQIITDRLKESAAQERSFASRVNVSLLIAVYDGDTETVQLLTTKGANVNQTRTIDRATLLWIAAQNGYTATAEILLDRGADVNKATIIGTTPLCIAAQNGHTATVELLLDRGADEKSLTKKQQALYAEEIAKAKRFNTQELESTIVDTAKSLALNLHGTPYEEVAQIVLYVIEAKGPDEKLEPNAIYNIALEALAKVEKAELLSRISQKEEILSLQDPTSVTDVEDESFVSRVKAGKTQDVSCNVM